MLETRLPAVSPMELRAAPLPRPAVSPRDGAARRVGTLPSAAAREASARPRPSARRAGQGRMARSEARLLATAVVGTALMCAVLVIYLAAYAHVCQLGLDQARARTQLRQARQENDILQAQLARLQSPARITAAAQALGMTVGTAQPTYISAGDTGVPAADGGDIQNFRETNSGASADRSAAAAFDH